MKFVKLIKANNEELSLDDFEIYKDGSYYRVKKLTDKASHIQTYDIRTKERWQAGYKLGVLIEKYNDRHIIEYRKQVIRKLSTEFRKAGLKRMQQSATSIRGWHDLSQGGYFFDKSYTTNNDEFKIGFYFGFNTDSKSSIYERYLNITKDILNKENLKYTEENGDIYVKLDKIGENKNMKFAKLIKAEETTEEQAQQYYSKTIEDEEARKLFLEARQKAIEICSKYGYEPRCSYGGSKEHPIDSIYADGPYNSYKPDISVEIYSPWGDGREGGRIQTTAYGSIPTDEYEEFLQSCQKAFACVKELEKEFIK